MIINFEKAKRCQCSNISNRYICSNKSKTLYSRGVKLYCLTHYRYYVGIYATRIQSVYRGNRSRRIINTIYKILPDELQYKILYYIRRDTYQKRYNKRILDAFEKRITSIYKLYFNNKLSNDFIYETIIINNSNKIINICRLFQKYNVLKRIEYYRYEVLNIVRIFGRIINNMADARDIYEDVELQMQYKLKIKKLDDTYKMMNIILMDRNNEYTTMELDLFNFI